MQTPINPDLFKDAFRDLMKTAKNASKVDQETLKSTHEIFVAYMDFLKAAMDGLPAEKRVEFAARAKDAFDEAMAANEKVNENNHTTQRGAIAASTKIMLVLAAAAAAAYVGVKQIKDL